MKQNCTLMRQNNSSLDQILDYIKPFQIIQYLLKPHYIPATSVSYKHCISFKLSTNIVEDMRISFLFRNSMTCSSHLLDAII
jgi:hypothetical protein